MEASSDRSAREYSGPRSPTWALRSNRRSPSSQARRNGVPWVKRCPK